MAVTAHIVDIDDPRLVKAFAHPIRMKILTILGDRTATPKELASILGLPLENVSYHVRTLKDFGFIKLERTRQVRGAVEHHYKLAARPRVGNKLWDELPGVLKEALADANLHVMIEAVAQAALQGGFDRGESHAVRHPLVLDDAGLREVSDILAEAEDRIEAVSEKAQERLGEGEAMRYSAVVMLFESPKPLPHEDATKHRDTTRRRRAQKSTA